MLQRVGEHPASRAVGLTPRVWRTLFADHPLRSDLDRARATRRPGKPTRTPVEALRLRQLPRARPARRVALGRKSTTSYSDRLPTASPRARAGATGRSPGPKSAPRASPRSRACSRPVHCSPWIEHSVSRRQLDAAARGGRWRPTLAGSQLPPSLTAYDVADVSSLTIPCPVCTTSSGTTKLARYAIHTLNNESISARGMSWPRTCIVPLPSNNTIVGYAVISHNFRSGLRKPM